MSDRFSLILSTPVFFLCLFFSVSGFVSLLWASGPQNWKVPAGYGVKIDSSGWSLPVDIQFVSQPQNKPGTPLYYVAESQGIIKVVTQDRRIFVYADAYDSLGEDQKISDSRQEFKIEGLCLDEVAGQIYVTMIYHEDDLPFNKIMRFGNTDHQLGLHGTKNWEMKNLLHQDPSNFPFSIGHCLIGSDRKLYVGVDDGEQPHKSQILQNINGKLLRINLDGTAPSDNPFYDPETPGSISSYIYAYGMRFPSMIAEGPDTQLYAGDSNQEAARLIQVAPGRNYLWEGRKESMLVNGIVTWSPGLAPGALLFIAKHPFLSAWNQHMLITAKKQARMEAIWVDSQIGARAPPETILEYIGNQKIEKQHLAAAAIGPDGIYFSGFFPQADGKTHIMKIVPDSSQKQQALQPVLSGETWYVKLECFSCHQLSGKGGQAGPALDNLIPRMEEYLSSQEYEKQLDRMDQLTEELFVQYKDVRQKLRQLEGKEKIQFWIESRLREPRFDAVDSQMPNLQLTEEQIAALTQYLMTLSTEDPFHQKIRLVQWANNIKFFLSTHLWIWLGLMLFLGVVIGLGMKSIFQFLWKRLFLKQ